MDPHGHCVRELARLAGVTLRTARRWKAAGRVPEPYATRAGLILDADLGALSRDWQGWSIRRGELISPEGLRLLPREIRALPLHVAALATYRAEARSSRRERELARALRHAREDLNAALSATEAAIEATRQVMNEDPERTDRASPERLSRQGPAGSVQSGTGGPETYTFPVANVVGNGQ